MAGTVQSLFGDMFKTPEQIRREQQAALMNEGRQSAGMLMAGGGSGLAQAIKGQAANIAQYIPSSADQLKRGALQAAGQIAGMQGNEEGKRALNLAAMSPEEQRATQLRQALKGVDIQDQASVDAAVSKLQDMGMTREAMALTQRSDALRSRQLEKDKFEQSKKYQDSMIEHQGKQLGFQKDQWNDPTAVATRKTALDTAKQTLSSTRSQEAGFAEIAGNPSALKGLGFTNEQVQAMADSENKAGWYPMIKARMEALDAGGTGDTLGGIEGEKANILGTAIDKLNSLEEGTPEWDKQNLVVSRLAEQFGANQTSTIDARSKLNAENAGAASTQNSRINQVVDFINKYGDQMKTGLSADLQDFFSKTFGTQSPEQLVRTQIQGIINSNIINDLPPGVASDKDVELVLKGALPANASPEQLKQYLNGIRQINEYKIQEQARYSAYVKDARNQINPYGYDDFRQTKMMEERKQDLIARGYPAAAEKPENLTGSGYFDFLQKVKPKYSTVEDVETYVSGSKSERDKLMGR
jgi:hypothetical protein